jgi:putative DNA primase/helicase
MTMSLIETFRAAMNSRDIAPPEYISIDTSTPQRFHIEGDRKSSKNGWYILHSDFPPAGAFGCWKRGINENFCPPINQSDTAAWRMQVDRMEIIRRHVNREQEKHEAIEAWEQASPATNNCRYLLTKQVKSHGLRYQQNAILVPVMDIDGAVHGFQKVWPDGSKRFAKGTDKYGNFFLIGNQNDTILIAEGYATAATLYEVTGHAAVVAFDAGNLLPAAVTIRGRYPNAIIVVCADNDQWTDGNPGLSAAIKASRTIRGLLAIPDFANSTSKPTDFNDLYCLEGAGSVRLQVTSVVEAYV